jgi:SAM-dependent methyltransferase
MKQSVDYSILADEYYRAELHPTCANFRTGSKLVVGDFVDAYATGERDSWCDLGAGWSVLTEPPVRDAIHGDIVLIDSSLQMLKCSRHHAPRIPLLVADALSLPAPEAVFDFVVISLGDPFNGEPLWQELRRVVAPGGRVCFTTPSFEWALNFRGNGDSPMRVARFTLRDGSDVYLPSIIFPIDVQVGFAHSHDFSVEEIIECPLSALREPISPKLKDCSSFLTGYWLRRDA